MSDYAHIATNNETKKGTVMAKTIKAVRSEQLSGPYDDRFVIVDLETGEILDDAQGYGYKTAQKAHIGYNYRNKQASRSKKSHDLKVDAFHEWIGVAPDGAELDVSGNRNWLQRLFGGK